MSRIEELIAELCPDGVEYRPLGGLLDYVQPSKYLVRSKNYSDSYRTPVLTAGQTFILGYTNEADGICPASPTNPVIIFDDFTTAFKRVDFPLKVKSSATKMLRPKPSGEVLLRFAYYAMQTITYQPQDHARQWISAYSQFRIPARRSKCSGRSCVYWTCSRRWRRSWKPGGVSTHITATRS